MSRTLSMACETGRTMSDSSFMTPVRRESTPPICPLKRQHSAGDDYSGDDEDEPPALEREPGINLAPRKLDLDQHVSFGDENDEEKDASKEEEKEEEEEPATQEYNAASQNAEEGELHFDSPASTEPRRVNSAG